MAKDGGVAEDEAGRDGEKVQRVEERRGGGGTRRKTHEQRSCFAGYPPVGFVLCSVFVRVR